MSGSITRGKDRKWQYVFDAPRHLNGNRRQIRRTGFDTKKDAAKAMRLHIGEVEAESQQAADPSELGVWMRHVWLPEHARELKRTTIEGYWVILDVHIEPDPISSIRLVDLARHDVASFLVRLANKEKSGGHGPLAARTQKNIFRLLKAALRSAEDQGLVDADVLKGIKDPRADKPDIRPWTQKEIATFARHTKVSSPDMHPIYMLTIATGMRRAEIAGLQWRHVDLEAETIRIEQTRVAVKGGWALVDPKTEVSRRTIHLSHLGVEALQAASDFQEQQRQLLGSAWIETGYVLVGLTGEPPHPDQITKRFQKDCQMAGLDRIRLHDLRHTFASNALRHGVNPKQVSAILGHSNVRTTLDFYAQFMPGAHVDAMTQINDILFSELGES